jgi:hypothetical protein
VNTTTHGRWLNDDQAHDLNALIGVAPLSEAPA